jgi:hypothetical protein
MNLTMNLEVKILFNKPALRYSVRRAVESAAAALAVEYPDLQVTITEISDCAEILKYTQVLMAPGLVINEKLVYDLWIPKKEQVIGWLREAILENA